MVYLPPVSGTIQLPATVFRKYSLIPDKIINAGMEKCDEDHISGLFRLCIVRKSLFIKSGPGQSPSEKHSDEARE